MSTSTPIPRWHRTLFVAAAVMTFVLVGSGGFVCVTDASAGCPDWPTCHGRLIPPLQLLSVIEWVHRIASPITLPVIITAAVVAWRRHRDRSWVVWPVVGAIAAIINVVAYGAIGVFWGLPRGWAAADLGTALLALALMVVAAVVIRRAGHESERTSPRLSLGSPLAKLTSASLLAVFTTIVSGVLVARPHSVVRCMGWPDLLHFATPVDGFDQLQLVRLGFAAVTVVMVLATVAQAWRAEDPALRTPAAAAGALVLACVLLGVLTPSPDPGFVVPMITMVCAEALWASLVVLTARVALD